MVEQTDEFEYKDEIRMILPTTDKTKNIVKQYNEKKTFIYNYGRLKPFLLSNGRYKMSKLIEPIIDDVIRTHTDSVFITYKLDGKIAVGENMGQLKCKGHFENFEVANINKYDGIFVKY